MRRSNVAGLAVVAAWAILGSARAEPAPSTCRLMQSDAAVTPTRECIACHDGSKRDEHPVDVDYARAQAGRRDLRPLTEVVKRGLFMPEGSVRCVTCHDGRSPWKYHLVLPPGAKPAPAKDPNDEGGVAAPLAPGSEVTPKPLCLACHTMD